MLERETIINVIQDAVDGCARNWAETIADALLKNGTYIYGKHAMDIIAEPRLTDPRFLNGWRDSDEEYIRSMFSRMPTPIEIYQRLGIYENLYEDGMLMQFKPIKMESGDETF